jgi:ABC-type cobalamin transport system ATPase subunit
VSFEVATGEVFCLLGPNGAGKTTTVEILEGYRMRDAGEVRVLGMDPADSPRELRERVGIVLQQTGVQGDLTVAELVEMYGRYYVHRRPVDELIDLVGLTEKRDVQAKKLSGGSAASPRPRARPGRGPRPDLPRRTDDRLRSSRPPPGVVDDSIALRAGQDGLPHDPFHG